jgi:hypothetical protein
MGQLVERLERVEHDGSAMEHHGGRQHHDGAGEHDRRALPNSATEHNY